MSSGRLTPATPASPSRSRERARPARMRSGSRSWPPTACRAAAGAVVEPGDIVCLHTGLAERIFEMGRAPDPEVLHGACAVLDGRDPKLLDWISSSGLAALAADNYAVEAFPASDGGGCCSILPLHEHCLFKNGIPLGEIWRLTPLANWLREHG